jgi:hypothetical protein
LLHFLYDSQTQFGPFSRSTGLERQGNRLALICGPKINAGITAFSRRAWLTGIVEVLLSRPRDFAMHCQTLYVLATEAEQAPGLRARCDMPVGSKLYRVSGVLSAVPTRTSLQIGASLHIDSGTAEWRFIEHSCAPNLEMDFRDWSFRANRDIPARERLTYNYLTTEAHTAAPFECGCGESACFGTIAGFERLAPASKRRLRKHIAPHLRDAEAGTPGGCIFGTLLG